MYVIPAMTNVKDLVRYADNDMEKFGKMNVNTENNFFVPLSRGEILENYQLRAHWDFLKAVQYEYLRKNS